MAIVTKNTPAPVVEPPVTYDIAGLTHQQVRSLQFGLYIASGMGSFPLSPDEKADLQGLYTEINSQVHIG